MDQIKQVVKEALREHDEEEMPFWSWLALTLFVMLSLNFMFSSG